MNDAGLQPAVALLNNRVRWYKLRQMMMPDAQGGGTSAKVQIDSRLRYAHTGTCAGHSKLPVDPCVTRSL